MRKKPILVICSIIVAAVLAGGVAFYLNSANEKRLEEQAVAEKQREIFNDLFYANRYNFTCYTSSGEFLALSLVSMAREDPAKHARIDFYDERPTGFEFEKIEDGVIMAFPSGMTKKSLAALNSFIRLYNVDTAALGFGPEVTMHDIVHRRAGIDALVEEVCREAPPGYPVTTIQRSIYDPEIEIMPSLNYASDFNFMFYTASGAFDGPDMKAEVWDNPTDYTRIDYYDELPAGIEPGDIEDGVIIAVPTEKTQRSLDRLNYLIKQQNIDITVFGLGPEITMYDAVHSRGLRVVVAKIQGGTPEETAALRDSIYNPE